MKTTYDEIIMKYRGNSLEAKAARVALSLFLATTDDPKRKEYEKLLEQAELEAWEEREDEDFD